MLQKRRQNRIYGPIRARDQLVTHHTGDSIFYTQWLLKSVLKMSGVSTCARVCLRAFSFDVARTCNFLSLKKGVCECL